MLWPWIIKIVMRSPLPSSSPARLSEGCYRPQHQKTFSMLNPVRAEDSFEAQNNRCFPFPGQGALDGYSAGISPAAVP